MAPALDDARLVVLGAGALACNSGQQIMCFLRREVQLDQILRHDCGSLTCTDTLHTPN